MISLKDLKNLSIKLEGAYFSLLSRISPTLNTKARYRSRFGKKINLKDPKTFNEKILWLKLNRYMYNSTIIQCADKYAVREYIKDQGLGDTLNELIGVYDSASQVPWDRLPEKFAAKWNFGSGFNWICDDKSNADIPSAIKNLNKWQNTKYHLLYSEMQYKFVKPKLLIEKYICDGHGLLPRDYKVYCFNGKPYCVAVFCGREIGHPTLYFFDREWNFLRINHAGMNAPDDFSMPKPEGIDKVFEYAEKLCTPFPFVRVDFYDVNGKVYFGELTFTPCGGLDFGMPQSLDKMFGEMIDLNYGSIENDLFK